LVLNNREEKYEGRKERMGILVRVPKEVERLIKVVGESLGYYPHSIRNTAILYGLMTIATTKTIPRDDQEFQVLLENVKDFLKKNLGVEV
jgi:hypothetical protein